LIHIQGRNFDPALVDTLVFVGNELNWFCTVEQLNTTDIYCRTPPASPAYNISLPQIVDLEDNLMADNTCGSPGACVFNYIGSTGSPQLSSISINVISSGSVILTGNNLNLYPPLVVLNNQLTGVVTVVTPTSYTATTIVFNVPNVESGPYNVNARLDPLG
jgi:hypothetical protein